MHRYDPVNNPVNDPDHDDYVYEAYIALAVRELDPPRQNPSLDKTVFNQITSSFFAKAPTEKRETSKEPSHDMRKGQNTVEKKKNPKPQTPYRIFKSVGPDNFINFTPEDLSTATSNTSNHKRCLWTNYEGNPSFKTNTPGRW